MSRNGDTQILTKGQTAFDPQVYRKDFPVLSREVYGKPLVYLDNAASGQMPVQVMDVWKHYHEFYHSNVHRGVHALSQQATDAYEGAREKIRNHINAASEKEIVYTYGTTDSINLVAYTYGNQHISEGDEVIISHMEHHSNIVPWKRLCDEKGARLKVIPINDAGELDVEAYREMLSERTKLVGIVHVSNALGTINPVKEIVAEAHKWNVPVLVDGAQAMPHTQVDVQDLDCDFYAFSSHKYYGPTGFGVLYGKKDLLEQMQPFRGGGEMILSVSFDEIIYNKVPYKFEAGTPSIANAIATGAAIDYLNSVGLERIAAYEHELLTYVTEKLEQIDGLKLIGTAENKASVISFVLENIHPHDIGTVLDQQGIAIRTGHHCAQPVMERFNIPATSRASFAFYNTKEEVDVLAEGIYKVIELFS